MNIYGMTQNEFVLICGLVAVMIVVVGIILHDVHAHTKPLKEDEMSYNAVFGEQERIFREACLTPSSNALHKQMMREAQDWFFSASLAEVAEYRRKYNVLTGDEIIEIKAAEMMNRFNPLPE